MLNSAAAFILAATQIRRLKSDGGKIRWCSDSASAAGSADRGQTRYDGFVELPDEDAPLVIEALEHLAAYRKAVQQDGRPYLELAEELMRKPPASQTGKPVRTKKAG